MNTVARCLSLLGIVPFAAACGSSPAPWGKTTPSTIEGTVVTASFPGTVGAFVAEDEAGGTVRTPIAGAGTFSMELPSGHHYRLGVETDRGTVRLVFPRAFDRVDAAFALETTQAQIALGSIRYIADPAAAPVAIGANACTDGTRADGALCTVTPERSQCIDGYQSAAAGTCSDNDLVLGYGALASLRTTSSAFAIAAQSPPCEVQGCYVPDLPNPPQTPTN